MAKNLRDNDVVFAVKIIDNIPQLVQGIVYNAGLLDSYIDWEKPGNARNVREHNDDLCKTPGRAITRFIRNLRKNLGPEVRKLQQMVVDTAYNNRIRKTMTTVLPVALVPWSQKHIRRGCYRFAYYICKKGSANPVLIRAYKSRSGKLQYHSLRQSDAILGNPVTRIDNPPYEIKDTSLWYLGVPQPWNKWLKRPKRDETLYGRKRRNDYTENT